MKKLIYILTAAALVQAACTNLDERVYDQLTADDYFDNFTEEDIPAALGSVYSDLRTLYAGDNVHTEGCWLYTNEETGDGWVTPSRGGSWYDGGIYQRLNNHTWNIDDAHILGNWRKAYAAINTCNRLMYEFGNADIKAESKEKLMAELHVARAFWYYVLCDMYGNVPLVTKYDVPKGWLPETAPRKEIFEFVVKEIRDNRSLLTEKGYGRWDYYAATMLLAKVTSMPRYGWGRPTGRRSWTSATRLSIQRSIRSTAITSKYSSPRTRIRPRSSSQDATMKSTTRHCRSASTSGPITGITATTTTPKPSFGAVAAPRPTWRTATTPPTPVSRIRGPKVRSTTTRAS